MGNMTITTPLSVMFCHQWAGTNYDQRACQIWSLYIYSLRRYEKQWKMQKLRRFGG